MKKLTVVFFVLCVVIMASCGGDDDNGPPGTNPLPTVTANTSVEAPETPLLINDSVWASVTATALDISMSIIPPTGTGKIAAISDSVYVQAISKDGMLYLRLVWEDATHDVTPENWKLFDKDGFNFAYNQDANYEDQLFVMFEGAPGGGWDTWNWRSHTTGVANRAECMTYHNSELNLDAGANTLATQNGQGVGSRPTYVHIDEWEFDGFVLYIEDILAVNSALSGRMNWRDTTDAPNESTVPGWVIDTTINKTGQPVESRWDVRTVYSYSDTQDRYTLVLTRQLNTSFDDDLDMSSLIKVKATIGILNNQRNLLEGTSRRGFTSDFWLELQ